MNPMNVKIADLIIHDDDPDEPLKEGQCPICSGMDGVHRLTCPNDPGRRIVLYARQVDGKYWAYLIRRVKA